MSENKELFNVLTIDKDGDYLLVGVNLPIDDANLVCGAKLDAGGRVFWLESLSTYQDNFGIYEVYAGVEYDGNAYKVSREIAHLWELVLNAERAFVRALRSVNSGRPDALATYSNLMQVCVKELVVAKENLEKQRRHEALAWKNTA